MKSVLISIQPKWCELIASGEKTVEVRKTKPKLETPFKCYIYETKDKHFANMGYCWGDKNFFEHAIGKVIGEFVCDRIEYIGWLSNPTRLDWKNTYDKNSCLTNSQLYDYSNGDCFYEWHISDLVIYDKPRELSEFYVWKKCNSCRDTGYESTACCYDEDCRVPAVITRPPQSWCYVESEDTE